MSDTQLERIQAQFTRTADVYARMKATTDERGHAALVAILDPPPGSRALDVACGPGFLTLALARRAGEVVGFDATDAFLDLARAEASRLGLANVRFEQGDAERLPFDDGAFDRVCCRAAFHHFPRPGRVLGEIARVCRRGGRILVADMLGSERPEQARLHDEIERLCDPTHARALPRSEFDRLIEGAGLVAVRAIESKLDYDLDEWVAHGAPAEAAQREIVSRMTSYVDDDRPGLAVRREDGRLRFTHRTAAFVLEHAPALATQPS